MGLQCSSFPLNLQHNLPLPLIVLHTGQEDINGTREILEDEMVPPVPPLPKDHSSYKSPPHSSASLSFPTLGEEANEPCSNESDLDHTVSLEVPLR